MFSAEIKENFFALNQTQKQGEHLGVCVTTTKNPAEGT